MFLRNRFAILSFTLMSLLTIPTLAENDNPPVSSRIENDHFDVEIKTPEGWSETKDFVAISETYSLDGQVYKGIQFKTGLENHGCVVFFADDLSDDKDDDEDNDSLLDLFKQAHEFAFPGSEPVNFSISRLNLDGSFDADLEKDTAKAAVKGTLYGTVSFENGETTPLTLSGKLHSDSTKGNFIVGSGTFLKEGSMPITGTTAILSLDDYDVLIALWGSTEEEQIKDAYRFIEALCVKGKVPEAILPTESAAEKGSNALAAGEPAADNTSDAPIANESVAEKGSDALTAGEPAADNTSDASIVTESVAKQTETASTEAST
ncbi:MAG TPA: hypothetical protein VHK67_04600 [Rhabdochlamydiaceae bacterium]|jgi:hypothetical protein|nr:hypothetical protein [Rhabdochlamydiaceae bacterium]